MQYNDFVSEGHKSIGLVSSETTTLFDANAVVVNYSYDQAGNLDSREHVNINEVVKLFLRYI